MDGIMSPLLLVLFFLLGLAAGSLANVLIARRKDLKSVFATRSRCPSCRKTLSALELIPIISYLWLRGRCRSCGQVISLHYAIVELMVALLFLWLASQVSSFSPLLLVAFLVLLGGAVLGVVLAATDLIENQYPSSLLYLMVGASLSYGVLASLERATVGGSPFVSLDYGGLVVGSLIGLGLIGGLYLLTDRRGVGEGDIYLGLSSGMLTGYPGVLLSLGLAFIAGGLVAALLLFSKRRRFGDALPFGPFILVATFLVVVYGERILTWLWAS